MQTALTAERLWNGTGFIDHPLVLIEEGRITSLSTQTASAVPARTEVVDFPGATLAPAFFDVHIHGAAGHDVMEATPEALTAMGSFLATRGTGSFLATTVTAPVETTLRSLSGLARLIQARRQGSCAWPVGIHLEGPFLSHTKRGVHPPQELLAPDIALFDRFYEAAEGHIRLMTLAPELPGAVELTAHAAARGVRVSLGHSNATAAETRAAIAAGAVSATHTFNAMRPLDHREPGILGVVLTDDALYAELICDGIHTAPEMVRLWWKAKGPHRALLVTDAMSATGMMDGEYLLGGFPVQVANGRATAGGVLAGSVLTLDRALCNFLAFTGARLEEGLPLLTRNPAAMTGLDAGALRVGGLANLAAVSAAGELVGSVVNGVVAPASRPAGSWTSRSTMVSS
jgi:N-acetylglucosamine-6-phosphate deacetylase